MLCTAHQVWEPGSEYTFNPDKAERVIGRNDGGDAEDDDGVRVPFPPLYCVGVLHLNTLFVQISLLNLWNFLTMMRSREGWRLHALRFLLLSNNEDSHVHLLPAGQRRDHERATQNGEQTEEGQ